MCIIMPEDEKSFGRRRFNSMKLPKASGQRADPQLASGHARHLLGHQGRFALPSRFAWFGTDSEKPRPVEQQVRANTEIRKTLTLIKQAEWSEENYLTSETPRATRRRPCLCTRRSAPPGGSGAAGPSGCPSFGGAPP